jgi:predicted enzyme related to lactoylglutathione lyase
VSERDDYPAGAPCWVENLAQDVEAGKLFYRWLFGWEWSAPGPMAGDGAAPYAVASLDGREVAGLGPVPDGVAPAWATQVCVASAEEAVERAERAGGRVLMGPIDILPAGRLVVLADPTGAAIGAFEPLVRRGAQKVNEHGAWALSILSTPDPDAAAAFYTAVFGWETEPFGGATMFRLPGYVGGEPSQPVPRDVVAAMRRDLNLARWDVDFWIRDADAAAQTARRCGGRILAPVHDVPPFRRAVLADPSGAAFSISQLVLPLS